MAEYDDSNFQKVLHQLTKLAMAATRRGDVVALKYLLDIAYLNGQANGLLHAIHDELTPQQMLDRAEAHMNNGRKLTEEKL